MSLSAMYDNTDKSCFILLETKYGRKKESYPSRLISNTRDKLEVLPGTLLLLIQSDNVKMEFETLDSDKSIQITCGPEDVENISSTIVDLLKPIPTCKERLEVYSDKEWLHDGQKLKEEDCVFVKLRSDQEELQGILRYKGSCMSSSKGIIFGVEFMERKGNSDGMYLKRRYFRTVENHAVFVPLHKVRRRRDDWQKNSRIRADENTKELYVQPDDIDCGLKIGERVVWMSDYGPEKGTVKWIGYLPGERTDDITVGVEFDQAVGTGTGKYKDHRLFNTLQGHASLIPLLGLIKEEEFESHNDPSADVSGISQSTPEFIKLQEQMLEKFSPSSPLVIQDKEMIKMPAYNVPGCSNASEEIVSSSVRPPGVVRGYNNGLNPLYEHSRLQESSTAVKLPGSSAINRVADPDLTMGSMVEVNLGGPLYGVIRWMGCVDGSGKVTAGLEMELEVTPGTDGTFKGERYFTCAPKKGLFVPLYKCSKDKRFSNAERKMSSDFGGVPTPDLPGEVPPPEIETEADFRLVCGKNRGIQGHHNSCYLDATLFCMFYFSTVFDFIFNRPSRSDDIPEYSKVQQALKEGIVNPLRKNKFVRADKVLTLRSLLDRLGTVEGMMGEEKDPEEFLSALLTDIMKADPLLHLSSGEHTYFYQLFMEKDEKLLLPTTQKLVELSFLQGNVKLKEAPSCLMIQMPRFGKDYKMFHRIVPSLQLDITDILENCPRDCIVCGGLATFECKDCYQVHGPGLNTTAFCEHCVERSHQHMNRRTHHPQAISTAKDFLVYYEAIKTSRRNGETGPADVTISLPREKMELFAVICIQTSHYVSFVKCGTGKDAPWVFFDSMADRMGEQQGYNIPEVVPVPELPTWLAESNFPYLLQKWDDKDLPEHLRRILCDGYMCMYQSTLGMMYQ